MILKEACWGIDIGKHAIKAVRVRRKDKTRLELNVVDRYDYPFTSDGEPTSEDVATGLKALMQRNPIKSTDSIAIALPGHMALPRFIKVPQLSTAELEGSIVGEAQQQIPFPLEEVIWGYQKIERDYEPGEDIEVGIFAIKKEIIYEYLRDFDDAGLEVDILTIAPLAIFNFIKYEMNVPDNVVVLDIGAHHTDLVIIEGNKFYVRELGLGGNEVTNMLADTFSISWEDAENLKRKTAQSTQAQKIFKILQPAIVDFVGEIQRSLGFYKSQSSGAKFTGLAMLGDATKLAGLPKFVGRQLDLKLHYFRDIDKLDLGPDLNIDILQEHLPSFAISIGLGLQGLGVTSNMVNLIPEERKGQKELARKMPILLGSVLMIFIVLAFLWWNATSQLSQINALGKKAFLLKEKLFDMQGKIADVTGNVPEGDKIPLNSIKGLETQANALASIGENRSEPLNSLNKLMKILGSRNIAGTNDRIHDDLQGLNKKQLRSNSRIRRDDDVEDRMNDVNKDKLWVLSYSSRLTRAEDGSEGLIHNLVGAIVDLGDPTANIDEVKTRLVSEIHKVYKCQGEITELFKGDQFSIDYLSTAAPQAKDTDKFYRFELEWTETIKGPRPAEFDILAGSGKTSKKEAE